MFTLIDPLKPSLPKGGGLKLGIKHFFHIYIERNAFTLINNDK